MDRTPIPGAAALDLAASARRVLVKVGDETRRFEPGRNPISRQEIEAWLVHPDGFLRVPVLVIGELLVRGYTEALYREALELGGGTP